VFNGFMHRPEALPARALLDALFDFETFSAV
jgi:hypothetical protein